MPAAGAVYDQVGDEQGGSTGVQQMQGDGAIGCPTAWAEAPQGPPPSLAALVEEVAVALGAVGVAVLGADEPGAAPEVLAAWDGMGHRQGGPPGAAGGRSGPSSRGPEPSSAAAAVARRAWETTVTGRLERGAVGSSAGDAVGGQGRRVVVVEDGQLRGVATVVLDDDAPVGALGVVGSSSGSDAVDEVLRAATVSLEEVLARHRLAAAERRHRLGLEHVRRHLALLVKAGDVLASASTTLEEPLRALARVVVPLFADWFTVDLAPEMASGSEAADEVVGRWRVASDRPQAVPCSDDPGHGHPDGDRLVARVLASGRSEMVVRRPAAGGAHLPGPELGAGRPAGLAESAIVVPVRVRGTVAGVASFVTWSGRRGYRLSDLRVAEGLAERIAVAVERLLLWREQQQAAELAEASRQRLQAVVDVAPVGIVELDRAGVPRWWNAAAGRLLLLPAAQGPATSAGRGSGAGLPSASERAAVPHRSSAGPTVDAMAPWVAELMAELMAGAPVVGVLRVAERSAGDRVYLSCSSVPLPDGDGAPDGTLVLVEDVSERERLANELVQSERLQAMARLASSVAHDFNNLLTVVLGSSELLLRGLDAADPLAEEARAVRAAGERAADLTSQLLSIGRRRALRPVPTDPDGVVAAVLPVISRVVGPAVTVVHRPNDEPLPVLAEQSELERALINLARNAGDAMPEGGSLEISVRTRRSLGAGPVVELAVADTGVGMAPEVMARCLEPFFTTKPRGQGTGLGLAGVHASVAQLGGTVSVESEVGRGTTVRLVLPAVTVDGPDEPTAAGGASEASTAGGASRASVASDARRDGDAGNASGRLGGDGPPPTTLRPRRVPSGSSARWGEPPLARPADGRRGLVLVVDDDPAVRHLAAQALWSDGWDVVLAGDGEEAMEAAATAPDRLDLVVTDLALPGMDGVALAAGLVLGTPDLPVIYMTGGGARRPPEGASLLAKPFSVAQLVAMARSLCRPAR